MRSVGCESGRQPSASGPHATLRVVRTPVHRDLHRGGARAARMSDAVVEIAGLAKRFGSGVLAVDDLSFTVEPGQVCGLLGPNGAGRPPRSGCSSGCVSPTSGDAYLFGRRVRPGLPRAGTRRRPDRDRRIRPAPVGHEEPRAVRGGRAGVASADADFDQALAIADLGDAVRRRVKTYSQGMRQRLGLARVLLGRPDVLVLDEPTNGLDPGEMREVRLLVHRLADAGATVSCSRATSSPRSSRSAPTRS